MDATTLDPVAERGLQSAPDPDNESDLTAQTREEEDDAAREKAAAEAAKHLSKRPGGITSTRARLQITGGAVEIDPDQFPDKDDELLVTVRGWVKTDKSTTEQKGGASAREAVVVIDEIVGFENKGRAQMEFGEDDE